MAVRQSAVLRDYSVDPAWQPSGRFVVYSGPDIGTTFSVKAVTPRGRRTFASASDNADARRPTLEIPTREDMDWLSCEEELNTKISG